MISFIKDTWELWGLFIVTAIIMFLMNGCSIFGIDLTDDRTITVVKSPYLINISGDVEEQDTEFVTNTLHFLSTQPFQKYEFKSVVINVAGSESDYKRLPRTDDKEIIIDPQNYKE